MVRGVMEDWFRDIRVVVIESVKNHGLPVPMSRDYCAGWARDLGLPRGGETIIYTSCMYQLSPLLNQLVPWLSRIRGMRLGRLMGVASRLAGLIVKPSPEALERSYSILRNMAKIIMRAGVTFGYLYEDEPYSGALLYELGLEDEFLDHVRTRVIPALRKYGVRRIITTDPHTHNVLTKVVPKYFDLDIEVRSYMDYAGGLRGKLSNVVIHDSCLYSRHLGMRERYREILDSAGITRVEDPWVTGKETSMCCGGPVEILNPELSHHVAKSRLESLSRLSRVIIVQCPICLANLNRVAEGDIKVVDLSEAVEA